MKFRYPTAYYALTLALALLCIPDAFAARIFVSQAPNASDNNVGNYRNPLRTIGAAVKKADSGDTVVVGAGDYSQEQNGFGTGVIPLIDKGDAEAPLVIQALKQVRPIIGRFLLKGSTNIRIRGFDFKGRSFNQYERWEDMPIIVRDEPQTSRPDFTAEYALRKAAIEREFATYFRIVRDLDYSSAIDIEDCSQIVISRNRIDGYWAGIQCKQATKILIENNQITHTVNGIFTFQPAPSLVDSIIRGNTIKQSLDNGIDIRDGAEEVQILRNDVTLSGRSHISLQSGSKQCRVIANKVRRGGFYSETMEFPGASAISLNDVSSGNIVANNEVEKQIDLTGIDGNGIILDFIRDGHRAVVRHNTVSRNAGDGLNTTESPNAMIGFNVFALNGSRFNGAPRGAGIRMSRDSDVRQTILGNVLLNNRTAGIQTSFTLSKQRDIDGNTYHLANEPLMLDGEGEQQKNFSTLEEVRIATPWETDGKLIQDSESD